MDLKSFNELVDKVNNNTATDAELAEYNAYLNRLTLSKTAWEDKSLGEPEVIKQELWRRIQLDRKPARTRSLWSKVAAAASIILVASFGYYLLRKQQDISNFKNDISPGHNQATLTLANGQKIILTKGLSGRLARQGNTIIDVNAQNSIAYKAGNVKFHEALAYNTLSTAIGEQSPFPLILADGTKVWLDAKSSITFPVAFTGKDRTVKITGQAYFEVVHDDAHPFKVSAKNQTVEDIGTHFNISAYDDDKVITTTLLEGAVKVSASDGPPNQKTGVMLKPGQCAILSNTSLRVANTEVEASAAWKNGYFRFDNEKIQTIMLKLSRWYNITVQYEGEIPEEGFYATSSRDKNISEVLTMLQQTKGVHFKIEGRRVTVMK